VILRTRKWRGGSTYDVTASPEQLVDRLPLPGEEIVLGEMGRLRVMSAYAVRDADHPAAGWILPGQRLWALVVQSPGIGPDWDDVPAPRQDGTRSDG
jgi:hypothetical protein